MLQNSYFKNTYIQGNAIETRIFNVTCKKWVKTKDSLDQHMSKYHYDPSVLLACPYQNYDQKCGNKQSLKRHIDWHKDIEKKGEAKISRRTKKTNKNWKEQQRKDKLAKQLNHLQLKLFQGPC